MLSRRHILAFTACFALVGGLAWLEHSLPKPSPERLKASEERLARAREAERQACAVPRNARTREQDQLCPDAPRIFIFF